MRRFFYAAIVLMSCSVGLAQQRPIFDPDDFLDPREIEGHVLLSARLVAGGAWNFVDDYRPLKDKTGFLQLGGGVYWRHVQFDYKHSIREGDHAALSVCACDPPIYFPTPPPPNATPAAPPPGARDSLQFGWYYSIPNGPEPRTMMRLRGTWTRQTIHQDVVAPLTGAVISRRSGREESFGLEGDAPFPFRTRWLFGTFGLARTTQSGIAGHRSQTEFTYSHRFPGFAYKAVLFRTIFTVGRITNRAGTAINLVNPYFEAFLHESKTRVNFHVVYSPQALNDGAHGWQTHHQVAIFADWGKVYLFGPHL